MPLSIGGLEASTTERVGGVYNNGCQAGKRPWVVACLRMMQKWEYWNKGHRDMQQPGLGAVL